MNPRPKTTRNVGNQGIFIRPSNKRFWFDELHIVCCNDVKGHRGTGFVGFLGNQFHAAGMEWAYRYLTYNDKIEKRIDDAIRSGFRKLGDFFYCPACAANNGVEPEWIEGVNCRKRTWSEEQA